MAIQHSTVVFLMEGDNILLAMKKRGFGAGRWNGVGGKVNPGESIQEAMIRETEEEIFVSPLEFEEAGKLHFKNQGGLPDMAVHVFTCTAWDGEPVESEEMAPHWFKVHEIPYDKMWQDDPYWLPQVLDGKFIRGNFVFDEHDNMLEHEVHEV
jgi:ADP-ribose pyrophosphatase YjhB (NUDIX family)